MEIKIQDIAKALGSLSASLAEATDSELSIIVLVKGKNIGAFLGGGEDSLGKEKVPEILTSVASHLKVLSGKLGSGEISADGTCYGMDEGGKVTDLTHPKKKPSTGEADISLLQ